MWPRLRERAQIAVHSSKENLLLEVVRCGLDKERGRMIRLATLKLLVRRG